MRLKFLIFTVCFVIKAMVSQNHSGMYFDFNANYFNESPELRDLTLKENKDLRSKLKIKSIIKRTTWVWPDVFSKHDSDNYKQAHSVFINKGHTPVTEYFFYNSLGILTQYYFLPTYFKVNKKDSSDMNELRIKIDSTRDHYVVNISYKNGCDLENYVDNLLIEEKQTNPCDKSPEVTKNKKDTAVKYYAYRKNKYSEDKRIIETEYNNNNEGSDKSFTAIEKFKYSSNKIYITRTPKDCKNCDEETYNNIVKLNKYGKVKESKFWKSFPFRESISYYCEYDNKQNLTHIYSSYPKKNEKELLYTYKYTYSDDKSYFVEFESNRGNKIIEFDSLGRMSKITSRGSNYIQTFEYK